MSAASRLRFVIAVAALSALAGVACARLREARVEAPIGAADAGATPAAADASAMTANGAAPAFGGASVPWDGAPIDRAVEAAIAEHKLPGCVVVVGSHDRILFRRAYGSRSVEPEREPMTVDTVFDLASLTKTIATATSLMVLEEKGVLSLDDAASKYVPAFSGRGKESVTLRQLLLHVSGLPAVTPHGDYAHGIDTAMAKIGALAPAAPPGTRFRYSDVGYIVLGEVVARASGKSLDVFAREAIFEPLGMSDTSFLPPATWRPRIAPTERRDGVMLRGEVHDPTAAALGGVAGNAGLFSTADDVARFAQAILGKGAVADRRVLGESELRRMLAIHDVPNGLRALGWDVRSSLSPNRSERLSRRAVGHGGYTGTALWIDQARDLFVVFLSNRVHPDGNGAVAPLVARVTTLAIDSTEGAEVGASSNSPLECREAPTSPVSVGIDVLAAEGFRRLAGKRVALLTNSGARGVSGKTTFRILKDVLGDRLTLLFVPEHGFGADAEGHIEDGALDGVPARSLYGARLSPDDEAMSRFDVLVVDLPDVGARFFTYGSTLHRVLKATSAPGRTPKTVIVLDRPNPLGGLAVDGPTEIPPGSFVQHHPLPLLHGMTLGELAYLLDADGHLGADLEVVTARGWHRGTAFDQTGLAWVAPSPNLPTFGAALAYGATALIEGTNVSVGRGTPTPFEVIAAPWLNADAVLRAVTAMAPGGVSLEVTTLTPKAGPYANATLPAVRFRIVDRASYRPVRLGLAFASALRSTHPTEWDAKRLDDMIGARLATGVREGLALPALEALYRAELATFVTKRNKYLLYGACIEAPDGGAPMAQAASQTRP